MMSLSHHSSNESSPDKKPAAADNSLGIMLLSDERKATKADNGSDHDQEDDEEGASSPSTLPPPAAAAAKGRAAAAVASSTARKKKATRVKKPKDMPRRPLSAYNLFFREERERMLNEHRQTAQAARGDTNEPLPEPKIGFENMAKTIGKRWKALSEEEMARYKDLAKEDMKRYRRERDAYHLELAKRSRLEREGAQQLTLEQNQQLATISAPAAAAADILSEKLQQPAVEPSNNLRQQAASQQQQQFSLDDILQSRRGGPSVNANQLMLTRLQQEQLLGAGMTGMDPSSNLSSLSGLQGSAYLNSLLGGGTQGGALSEHQLLLLQHLQLQRQQQQEQAIASLLNPQHAQLQVLQQLQLQRLQQQQQLQMQAAAQQQAALAPGSLDAQMQYQLLMQQLQHAQGGRVGDSAQDDASSPGPSNGDRLPDNSEGSRK